MCTVYFKRSKCDVKQCATTHAYNKVNMYGSWPSYTMSYDMVKDVLCTS